MKERKYFETIWDAKKYVSYQKYENGVPYTINRSSDGHYLVIADYPSKLDYETPSERISRKRNEKLNQLLGE